MSWLTSALLVLIHALYRLVLVFKSVFRSDTEPRPLTAERSKLPQHLALALVPNPEADDEANEQYLVNSVEKVAAWCRVAGIHQLSVYDREGVLARCSLELRRRLQPSSRDVEPEDSPVDCDIQYPLTPPPSDDADSRPLSPQSGHVAPKLGVTTLRLHADSPKPKKRVSALKRRRISQKGADVDPAPLTLHILSYQSGKPAVAAAAGMFLHYIRHGQPNSSPTRASTSLPSISELNAVLEGESGFPSPDLMIVHRKPPVSPLPSPAELGGFPPWQTRLTEIYWDFSSPSGRSWRNTTSVNESSSIEEAELRRALDEFAGAEMRLGK